MNEDKIQELHDLIKLMFPHAVSVEVFVNCQGIEVNPKYKTNLIDSSMRKINGEWVRKGDKK